MKPNYELHNLISKEFSEIKKGLEAKSKTKRGLTLEEDLFLHELAAMEARGLFTRPLPNVFIRQSENRECIDELKSELMLLTKNELAEQLAIAKLRIEELENFFENEDPELSFFKNEYKKVANKRLRDKRTMDRERNINGKGAINLFKFKIAKDVMEEMNKLHGSIKPFHSREFYKKLDNKCDEAGVTRVSINTRRNYFKQLTGFSSTK